MVRADIIGPLCGLLGIGAMGVSIAYLLIVLLDWDNEQ
jgi:hypothetical protein